MCSPGVQTKKKIFSCKVKFVLAYFFLNTFTLIQEHYSFYSANVFLKLKDITEINNKDFTNATNVNKHRNLRLGTDSWWMFSWLPTSTNLTVKLTLYIVLSPIFISITIYNFLNRENLSLFFPKPVLSYINMQRL